MKITKVSMAKGNWDKVRALASITLDDCLVVGGFKVMEGSKGLFVSMPNRKTAEGEWKDVTFPITKEFREILIDKILKEYGAESGKSDTSNDDDMPF